MTDIAAEGILAAMKTYLQAVKNGKPAPYKVFKGSPFKEVSTLCRALNYAVNIARNGITLYSV